MDLREKLQTLTAYYLDKYADLLCDKDCNDIQKEDIEFIKSLFSNEEVQAFEREFQRVTGTPEDYNEKYTTLMRYDWAFPLFLTKKLKIKDNK